MRDARRITWATGGGAADWVLRRTVRRTRPMLSPAGDVRGACATSRTWTRPAATGRRPRPVPRPTIERRTRGYGAVAVGFLRAVVTDAAERLIVNTANMGRLPFLDDDAVVEAPDAGWPRGVRAGRGWRIAPGAAGAGDPREGGRTPDAPRLGRSGLPLSRSRPSRCHPRRRLTRARRTDLRRRTCDRQPGFTDLFD